MEVAGAERLERAVVVSFDVGSYTATVRYEGSLSTVQSGVPVSRSIPAWQLRAGDGVVVAVFDELVAGDRCVVGVRGVTRRLPGCRVFRNVGQSIPHATEVALSFTSVRYDTDGMWSAGLPTRLTVQTAGRYVVGAGVTFDAGGGSWRQVALFVSGVGRIAIGGIAPRGGGAGSHVPTVVADWSFSAGQYVEVQVWQDSGGSLSVPSYGEPFSAEAWMHWVDVA